MIRTDGTRTIAEPEPVDAAELAAQTRRQIRDLQAALKRLERELAELEPEHRGFTLAH